MSKNVSGTWSGSMVDAQGFHAQATLELRIEEEIVKGDVQFQPILDHAEEPQKGKVVGRGKGDRVELMAELDSPVGKTEIQFDGIVWSQKTAHALSTIYGTYRVSGQHTDTLSVGIGIFWLYGDEN